MFQKKNKIVPYPRSRGPPKMVTYGPRVKKKVSFWGDGEHKKKPTYRHTVYFYKHEPPSYLYAQKPSIPEIKPPRNKFQIETQHIRAKWKLLLKKRMRQGTQQWTRAYKNIVDIVGSPLQWPEHICSERFNSRGEIVRNHPEKDLRVLLLKRGLRYNQRFCLSLFLISNGVNPVLVMEYFKINQSIKEDAYGSIQAMFDTYSRRDEKSRHWYSYDLINKRWENMNGEKMRF